MISLGDSSLAINRQLELGNLSMVLCKAVTAATELAEALIKRFLSNVTRDDYTQRIDILSIVYLLPTRYRIENGAHYKGGWWRLFKNKLIK